MSILVTGATGFIGSELVRQLLDKGEAVRILRRRTAKMDLLGEAAGRVEHAEGDVTDVFSVQEAMQGITHVYHTAGYIGFGGKREREQLYRVNVAGTANVVNVALEAGVQRLVHTSSMAAFGRPMQPTDVIDETSQWTPSRANSAYAQSKYEGELEVFRAIHEGLDAVIVNPALVFGVGRKSENTRQIAERIRDQRLPGIPTGGTNVVDVRDVAAGHIAAMERGRTGERYFLGAENLSYDTIIRMFANAFGVPPPKRVVRPRPALFLATLIEFASRLTGSHAVLTRETVRNASTFYRYDNRKAVQELGLQFRPFEETVRWMAGALR